MERRSHEDIPLFAAALRKNRRDYRPADFRSDLLAGITVGIVAVPLAMALAIASGVPPQHGLYTAIVAGVLIALTGGTRFNISGPTAAFVVILLPITQTYGLGGLLTTTVMAGIILVAMGAARMGRLIQFIPYPVTTGFTAGIAVVIAFLQVKDFLGLETTGTPHHFLEKMGVLIEALPTFHGADLLIGSLTLAVLLLWPRLKTPVPAHLMALFVGALSAWAFGSLLPGFEVATIGSRFHYDLGGMTGNGIPPVPPMPVLPWNLPDAQGQPLTLSFELIRNLIPPAITVAILGAIESLLCAVVADGLTGTRHDPDSELIGQGLGNLIAPFFGGIPATAAIARTATNIRAGGRSPLAAVVHALVVLAAILSMAELLAQVPMAALAALLLVVAWNMSEARHFLHILRVAPGSDVAVLLTCFALTVFFDMVLAVSVGVVLASFLFIRRMSELSGASHLDRGSKGPLQDLPANIAAYEITGPLFFGAAGKAVSILQQFNRGVEVLIINMASVPAMDMTGIVALESLLKKLEQANVAVVLSGLSPALQRKLLRAGIRRKAGMLAFSSSLEKAAVKAERLRPPATGMKLTERAV